MFPPPTSRDAAAHAAWRREYSHRVFNEKLALLDKAIARRRLSVFAYQIRTSPSLAAVHLLGAAIAVVGRKRHG
jgi:hypothetical protein